VCGKLDAKAVFLAATIISFNRKRLIEYKVPFIVPQNLPRWKRKAANGWSVSIKVAGNCGKNRCLI
jgi:hypothetical protein